MHARDRHPTMIRPGRLLRMAALLALAPAVAGCAGRAARGQPRVPILVARVERRAVPFEIDATGTVEPTQSASVTAQVQGLVGLPEVSGFRPFEDDVR